MTGKDFKISVTENLTWVHGNISSYQFTLNFNSEEAEEDLKRVALFLLEMRREGK
jgi:hypothetical protein